MSADNDRSDFAQFSRMARMAGNIAGGMISRGFYCTEAERELIAQVSVDVAHRQVVLLRGKRDPDDQEVMDAAAKKITALVDLVQAERERGEREA